MAESSDDRHPRHVLVTRFLALPPFLRPAAVVLPAMILLHLFLSTGAADRATEESASGRSLLVDATIQPKSGLSHQTALELIRANPKMQQRKSAVCGKAAPHTDLSQNPYRACAALHDLGLLQVIQHGEYFRRVTLTPDGYQRFSGWMTEEADRYVFEIAEARPVAILSVAPTPGYDLRAKALPATTRVTFTWRWDPLNDLGRGLGLAGSYEGDDSAHRALLIGHAYFEKKHTLWRIVEVELNDTSVNEMAPQ